MASTRKVFLNLSVRDLPRAKSFFGALGFGFNPQFTDDNAACMVIGDDAYAMLLTEAHFRTFTPKAICDTKSHAEGIFAVSCESRAEVDELMKKVIANGGSTAGDPQDHGFMYLRSFYDPDGHHWELFWMDPATVQAS